VNAVGTLFALGVEHASGLPIPTLASPSVMAFVPITTSTTDIDRIRDAMRVLLVDVERLVLFVRDIKRVDREQSGRRVFEILGRDYTDNDIADALRRWITGPS